MVDNRDDKPATGSAERSIPPRTDGDGRGPLYGLLAEFKTPAALKKGARAVRDGGHTKFDCYSPFPIHGIDAAMGVRRTILPWVVFLGGLTGTTGGLLLQWWTNAYDWPWIVSGKPFFSLPANIPITFEATVLLAAFTAFFGLWAFNGLPKLWHPLFRKDRFRDVTDNRFFIGIEARDPRFERDKTAALLRDAGATAVEEVHIDPDPAKKRVPRPIVSFIIITSVLAIIPFVLVARARATKSSEPHLHIIPDMDFQFKLKPQAASDLFPDGRGTRPKIDGTVAYGDLEADLHFSRGLVPAQPGAPAAALLPALGGSNEPPLQWATTFPVQIEVGARTMERGRERFNIYCAPCHGASGYGNGMVWRRAEKVPNRWKPPTSLQAENVIRQPHGQIFSTIGNGFGLMSGYAGQISERDRWAIVLYVRALQRSQNASIADVPADKVHELQ